jgi:flagellar basal-body rod protein FlgB
LARALPGDSRQEHAREYAMSLTGIPLMQIIKGKMDYTNQRERLISENVANADTPGFAPHDLTGFTVKGAMQGTQTGGGLTVTNAMHIATAPTRVSAFKDQAAPDSEARLDGNQVVLEEQMAKMTQSRIDYEAAVDFYQQSLNLLQTAAKAPGK